MNRKQIKNKIDSNLKLYSDIYLDRIEELKKKQKYYDQEKSRIDNECSKYFNELIESGYSDYEASKTVCLEYRDPETDYLELHTGYELEMLKECIEDYNVELKIQSLAKWALNSIPMDQEV